MQKTNYPLVTFGKRWLDPDLAGWLLDWSAEGDLLHLMLDYRAVVRARKVVSMGQARWRLGDDCYQTHLVSVGPAQGVMRVTAKREKGRGA